MNDTTSSSGPRTSLTLLGTGAMGTALGRAWLAAGHSLTVWNRTPERTAALTAEGAVAADSAAAAVAANRLVVACLLDDTSVGAALEGADLTGRDLVNLTTGTPPTPAPAPPGPRNGALACWTAGSWPYRR
ncbi:NAD(P)-binding domain-containing protein [Streptomyces nogalater]